MGIGQLAITIVCLGNTAASGMPSIVDQGPPAGGIQMSPTDLDPQEKKKDPVGRGDGDAQLIPHPTGSFCLVKRLNSQTQQMVIPRFRAGSDTLLWKNIDNTTPLPIYLRTTLFPASLHPQTV